MNPQILPANCLYKKCLKMINFDYKLKRVEDKRLLKQKSTQKT